jgi:hypothetical protein
MRDIPVLSGANGEENSYYLATVSKVGRDDQVKNILAFRILQRRNLVRLSEIEEEMIIRMMVPLRCPSPFPGDEHIS